VTGDRWAERWRNSRPTRLLILSGALAALIVLCATAFLISETRDKEISAAKRELLTLNLSLTEQTTRAIQGVDLVLKRIAEQIRSDGVDDAEAFSREESGSETSEMLRARAADLPQLDAVTLIAADGHLVNFSRSFPAPPANAADRDYFQALQMPAATQPFLSAPVQNLGTGTWTLYIARRVDSSAGQFIGLVLGAIDLGYFENLYRDLAIGPGSGISLWRRDGTLLARYPAIEGVGSSFQIKSFTETLRHSAAGVYEVEKSLDGYRRIVATRSLRDYPLVVNVTRTLNEILADWNRLAMMIAAAGALVTAAAVLVVLTLARQFATYERLSHALAEKSEAVLARKEAEGQLHQAQKLDAVGKLTTGIAHDFNNLLTAMVGNLEFLRRDIQSPTIERRVSAIQKAADRAATLTGQLLAFSRKQHLFPEPVDLNRLIGNMADMLRSTLGTTITIELSLHKHPWRAFVDSTQIELVLLNLAINARDAMPAGGVLAISTDNVAVGQPIAAGEPPAGEHVLITVRDTGAGMTDDVRLRAFDPFFTTKPPGKGTGLGLSQAYGMVRQSGGSIQIDSAPGHGTTVRIYLPRSETATSREGPIVPAAGARMPHSRPGKVLVVDDDSSVRSTVSEMVQDLGFTVLEADGGHRALDLLAGDAQIDLVVMDFAMPELDGAEVARRARQTRPDLPVVFVTGFAEVESLQGEEWVLQKPFCQETLATKLHLALGAAAP
jgi:signal transduction histidine kinase